MLTANCNQLYTLGKFSLFFCVLGQFFKNSFFGLASTLGNANLFVYKSSW